MDLKLDFVLSAYTTAQSMIRFSDQKAALIFLFYGIFLALLGLRVGRLLDALQAPAVGGLVVVGAALLVIFFGLMCHSLMYALRTIAPTFGMASRSPDHRGLYWFEQVRRRDVRDYVQTLRGLSDADLLEEMAHELYAVQAITQAKFDRVQRAVWSAAAGLTVWQVLVVVTFFL